MGCASVEGEKEEGGEVQAAAEIDLGFVKLRERMQ